ncbi:MAG TPA: hypothetical protein VJH33_01305 [Candidatus Paceibacterota bacterium]
MDKKTFFLVSAVIFGLVALVHLARVFWGWDASIGGWYVPTWASWLAILVGGFMSWHAWQFRG